MQHWTYMYLNLCTYIKQLKKKAKQSKAKTAYVVCEYLHKVGGRQPQNPPHITHEELRNEDLMDWRVPKTTDVHSRIKVNDTINKLTCCIWNLLTAVHNMRNSTYVRDDAIKPLHNSDSDSEIRLTVHVHSFLKHLIIKLPSHL